MTALHSLRVRHNIEVAHRLSLLPGSCQAIHGHSMWVNLEMSGDLGPTGLVENLDFAAVKRAFRGYLDSEYDHRLLLNTRDQWADYELPGLRRCPADPTTENIAAWVGQWAAQAWPVMAGIRVTVNETHVNAAAWQWGPA